MLKHNLKTLTALYIKLDELIAKLPKKTFDKLGSASIALGTEFDEIHKELREMLAEQERFFRAQYPSKYKLALTVLKEILGETEQP